MRDMLFKGKTESGMWIEGDLIHYESGEVAILERPFSKYGYESVEIVRRTKVLVDTICQYTGLTDKNGNKIWENDIVKKHFYTDYDAYANSEEYVGIVEFTDCAWVIKTKNANRECSRPIIESLAYSHDVEYFEVIGNIFDNPELLGNKTDF